jgi:hypothetical protein
VVLVHLDIGIARRHRFHAFVPVRHGDRNPSALRRRGEVPAETVLGKVEAVLEDSVDADAGHDGFLQHGFALGALEDSPAHAGVFAFGVLANDVAVDVTGLMSGERTPHAGHEFDRTQVDVLVEGAAKLQQAAPQRDVVGYHVGPSDRTEEDRLETGEDVPASACRRPSEVRPPRRRRRISCRNDGCAAGPVGAIGSRKGAEVLHNRPVSDPPRR